MKVPALAYPEALGVLSLGLALSFPACEMEKLYFMTSMGPPGRLNQGVTVRGN